MSAPMKEATAPKPDGTAVQILTTHPRMSLAASKLSRIRGSMEAVLPHGITPDRMIKMALLQMVKKPELLDCTVESIAEAVMTIASWGLEIGRTAHLVPYGKTATAIADYKGKIELAIRGESITSCRARVVYERDHFEIDYGLNEALVHRPAWQADAGKPIGVYAIVRLPTGEQKFELMSADQVEHVRQKSRAKDNGPWKTDPDEMWKKTAVHRLLKMVPQNPLLVAAFEADLDDREETAAVIRAQLSSEPRRQIIPAVRSGGYDDPPPPEPTMTEEESRVLDQTLLDAEGPRSVKPEVTHQKDVKRPTSPPPPDPYREPGEE